MATRAQLRSLLRRRLNEVEAAQWTDSVLNDHLDSGLAFMQERIIAVDPYAIVYTDTTPLVNGQQDYPKPLGFRYEVQLEVSTDNGSTYKVIDGIDLKSVNEATTSDGVALGTASTVYAHKGRYFRLYPIPSVNSTAGLRLQWVPTLTFGADDTVPDIPLSLHTGIAYRAEMLALGETGEAAELAEKELGLVVNSIPIALHKTVPDRVDLGFQKWTTQ